MLNMSSSSSAISRLIECKQENLLDLKHMEMMLAGNQLERDQQQQQQQQHPQIGSLTGGTSEPEGQFQLPALTMDETSEKLNGGVHFGAKMAISILMAIILLVMIATLVDYQQQANEHQNGHNKEITRRNNNRGESSSSKSVGLRDYRSLSLSSNCSSNNHFCSTNSVASSSAPILSNNLTPTCQLNGKCNTNSSSTSSSSTSPSPPPMASNCSKESNHYESNLQMHFCTNHEHEQQTCCFKPLTINMPLHQGVTGNSPPAYLSPTSYTDSYTHVVMEQQQQQQQQQHENFHPLGTRILLAFSLRQSARQIFDTFVQENKWEQVEKKEKTSMPAQAESVDSLHGLRFLSMIWVIIIHSYNFALRWMFFSNTTTLDGIYKSAASQLIANGSFACDSFFFAGGFLLPYLAFEYESAGELTTSEDQQAAAPNGSNSNNNKPTTSVCNCQLFSTLIYAHETRTRPLASSTSCESCGSVSPQVAILVNGATSSCGKARHELNTNEEEEEEEVVVVVATGEKLQQQQQQQQQQPQQQQQQQQQPQPTEPHDQMVGRKVRRETRLISGRQVVGNICHRYVRMMPLMMAIIGLCSTLMRYLGEGPIWQDSTMMYDGWCRKNWWINAMFLHNFVNRENMCLSHSWYSAVDLQLFLIGQLILYVLSRSRRWGLLLLGASICLSQVITIWLTLAHHLPAVPLVSSVNEQTMNLYYGEIYIKPYCRASPYLIGILLAYLMRTTKLGSLKLHRWQIFAGWSLALSVFVAIILAMQPAMNGHSLSNLESALYSALSRPLWALATGWMIYACITQQAGLIGRLLEAKCFIPLSRLTYPAFLIHPIVMALFYGSRQASFHFSHYLMLYLILGNIVITYACAFLLAALFELPLLSIERILNRKRSR